MSHASCVPPESVQLEQDQIGDRDDRDQAAFDADRFGGRDRVGLPAEAADDDVDNPLTGGLDADDARQRIVGIAPADLGLGGAERTNSFQVSLASVRGSVAIRSRS